ncbi:MAG: nicotinate (nicotinamide) nucleotide adenylyltransferase [Lentisphaeria bacterium]|nr:nicotinate (nicotinamide) nucleotide adenylyltransferase [Lentisphaeria bacterium]
MPEENLTAVFGGTFDPVHTGHTGLAEYLLKTGRVNRVVFLPAPHPPHKPGNEPAPFADRAAMLRAAIAGHPGMSVSELEAERSGLSYTVDTLGILKQRYPAEHFVWVIGSDSLNQLHQWYESERLVRENRFLAYPRPGAEADFDQLRSVWPPELFEKLRDSVLTDAPEFDLSSTEVRTRLSEQGADACRDLLPEPVLNYIKEHKLYSQRNGDTTT